MLHYQIHHPVHLGDQKAPLVLLVRTVGHQSDRGDMHTGVACCTPLGTHEADYCTPTANTYANNACLRGASAGTPVLRIEADSSGHMCEQLLAQQAGTITKWNAITIACCRTRSPIRAVLIRVHTLPKLNRRCYKQLQSVAAHLSIASGNARACYDQCM